VARANSVPSDDRVAAVEARLATEGVAAAAPSVGVTAAPERPHARLAWRPPRPSPRESEPTAPVATAGTFAAAASAAAPVAAAPPARPAPVEARAARSAPLEHAPEPATSVIGAAALAPAGPRRPRLLAPRPLPARDPASPPTRTLTFLAEP